MKIPTKLRDSKILLRPKYLRVFLCLALLARPSSGVGYFFRPHPCQSFLFVSGYSLESIQIRNLRLLYPRPQYIQNYRQIQVSLAGGIAVVLLNFSLQYGIPPAEGGGPFAFDIWDIQGARPVLTRRIISDYQEQMFPPFTLSKDGRYLASAESPDHIAIWDLHKRERPIEDWHMAGRMTSLKFIGDSVLILAGTAEGRVTIHGAHKGIEMMKADGVHPAAIHHIAETPGRRPPKGNFPMPMAATLTNLSTQKNSKSLILLHGLYGSLNQTIWVDRSITEIALSPTGRWLAGITQRGEFLLYHPDGKLEKTGIMPEDWTSAPIIPFWKFLAENPAYFQRSNGFNGGSGILDFSENEEAILFSDGASGEVFCWKWRENIILRLQLDK
jgi:WD40 repeat protein